MRLSQMVGRVSGWRWIIGLAAGALLTLMPGTTETATANGETRTLNLYHAHTHESISAVYMVNGAYDQGVLDKLNWFLRDWRRDEATKMDPRLFDTVWEVYRESGSQQPIEVMSAYRSPETNAMLRRRSRQVAEHSQHILGKAMDQHYMDVPMSRIRELGMRLQRGGVGFYPTAGSPFVHLDVGGVRHWPRMSYDQLARLFPDGKTVHIPSNGQPLPGYELARAELEARGDGSYPTASEIKSKGFFAWLFGGGSDEDEDNEQAGLRSSRRGAPTRVASLDRGSGATVDVGSYGNAARDAGTRGFFSAQPPQAALGPRAAPPPIRPEPPPQVVATPPAPAAEQVLATAMVADEHKAQAAPPVVGPVADLPVPAKALVGADPTQAPRAPLPPRRPVELAALGPAAPVPPIRPSELASLQPHDAVRSAVPGARPDPIASLIGTGSTRMARLPDVITQGSPGSHGGTSPALGYAAQPSAGADRSGSVPLPVARPLTLVSTHLDRSNFRTLTGPEKTDRTAARSVLGTVVPPVRAAARADLGTLVPLPSARPTVFRSSASDLPTERFGGTAGKPAARAGTSHTDLD